MTENGFYVIYALAVADPRQPEPTLITRRAFLQTSAAAAASLSLPLAISACGVGGDNSDDAIVAAAIHPAIGIARVGNSADTFFFGPEVPGTLPRAPGGFKDKQGAIARQAAHFRVYGLDRNGVPVKELLAGGDTTIAWRVHVANSKAAWYQFQEAFDIPGAPPAARRNNNVAGAKRASLVIDPGEQAISGIAHGPVKLDGRVFGKSVNLGELLTDVSGRLVFLPGPGRGYTDGSNPLTMFAGNDGWSDDACDGSVRATVKLGKRTLEAEPAWVIATPPNYGPAMATGLVTAYDAARSMFVGAGVVDAGKVSFANDILPIFTRLTDMQWVNEGFFESNGWGSKQDWDSGAQIERLADPSAASRDFRRGLFKQFRNPAFRTMQSQAVPQMYGDGVSFTNPNPRLWLAVTPLQYDQLRQWAEGQFTDDRAAVKRPVKLSQLPVEKQPLALDQAALESCLGGAFHPGIEVPWVLRRQSVWKKPYRLKVSGTQPSLGEYGPQLNAKKTFAPGGPLQGCAPGDLTRWLGVPWHSDAASCRSGYQRSVSPVLPTFWPARIPTTVLAEEEYRIVMDRSRSIAERQAAFKKRRDWERFIAAPTRPPTLDLMMKEWPKLGMITERPGPGDPEFPKVIKVESLVGFVVEPQVEYGADLWVPQVPAP
ncbi:MAG: LodA/GoxA family CTQ-dependent oxidase [Actinomycetota bacterium]